MKLNAPKQKQISLYEAIVYYGIDKDCGDDVYDYLIYIDFDREPTDYYDKCMAVFAMNIPVLKVYNQNTICDISGFINRNLSVFNKFLNEVYVDEYKPKNIGKIEYGTEEFYDIYLEAFKSLVNGGFSEKHYELLWRIINHEPY